MRARFGTFLHKAGAPFIFVAFAFASTLAAGSAGPGRGKAAPELAAVPAMGAAAFVDGMGVDVDLVHATFVGTLAERFAELGVHRTRIAVLENDPHYESVVRNFFARLPRVRSIGLINCAPPLGPYPTAAIAPSDVRGFESRTQMRLAFVEGPNEPNVRGDRGWADETRRCLAPFLAGDDAMRTIAPALSTSSGGQDHIALGDLGAVARANVHRYFSGRDPDTGGWGDRDACGVYGALAWSLCWAKTNSPGKPVVVTETGWNSATEVDEAVQAAYVRRVFFVNAAAGVSATYLYALASYEGGDGFGGDGLLDVELRPKPSFVSLRTLVRELDDGHVAYRPQPLRLALSPAPVASGEGLRATLLGKADGSYALAVWQEKSSADPDHRGRDVTREAMRVTLSLAAPFYARVLRWTDDGRSVRASLGRAARFELDVDDRLELVELGRRAP